MQQPKVIIAGAGMAGMTAALRLIERGYDVTLLEQDDFVGGKFSAHTHNGQDYHEHCYHMFLNWFHNFWGIIDELDLWHEFEQQHSAKYVRKGEYPHMTQVRDMGAPESQLTNLFDGPLPFYQQFIYQYSLIDLLSQPFERGEFLDRVSVNGFMRSRGYSTDEAAVHHDRTLAKSFAVPSYRTSAAAYKRFIQLGSREPSPMMWVMKGNCQQHFWHPFVEKVGRERIRFLTRVDKLHLDATGRIEAIDLSTLDSSPRVHRGDVKVTGTERLEIDGDLLLTIPPPALARLVDGPVYDAAPELGGAANLRTEPMAALDLFFKGRIADMPEEHVVLLGSKYGTTFIDNGQLWPGQTSTYLNVIAAECHALSGMKPTGKRAARGNGPPESAEDFIIDELREYVPFELDDIDWDRTHMDNAAGAELFITDVGSWQYRPETTCRIPNLFLAGDFCRTPVDVVTLEGATVSGLQAVEAIRKRRGVGGPVRIVEPDVIPEAALAALKVAGAPYAYAAKALAFAVEEWPTLITGQSPRR